MSWRPVSYDPATGIGVWWRWNGDGTATVRHTQDVEPVLDRNQAMATHNDGYSPSRDLRRAASIPSIVLTEYRNNKGINLLDPSHEKELKKVLNDIDFRKFRTAPGRI